MRFGDLPHLVRRFVASMRPAPVTPQEQLEVAALLEGRVAEVFWAQPRADIRHALGSLRRLRDAGRGRPELERAVLLHDIGKRHSRLGLIGRSIASGLAVTRLPRPARLQRYLDHGSLGAEELRSLGVEPLVVAFAAHHHGSRPDKIERLDWEALVAADDE